MVAAFIKDLWCRVLVDNSVGYSADHSLIFCLNEITGSALIHVP